MMSICLLGGSLHLDPSDRSFLPQAFCDCVSSTFVCAFRPQTVANSLLVNFNFLSTLQEGELCDVEALLLTLEPEHR